ncbi:Mannan endo-1,6-alpha-mannosidase DCW1-like protein 4 [Colletotrichum chlorophyti]|uniref:Mannan endo-1,6-alpha-mannosidase n=1 Tax=Colletotrichum chlorophyti TaxID=708187 RepID=A0A1Q8S4A2_9PEZI|nr:Mannan endo-1,6-alpha-mannosidase DCW1-like protein 4 [Colletotrichum chlorophyti]
MIPFLVTALPGALLLLGSAPLAAAELKLDSRDDIVKSSKTLAKDLISYYKGEEYGEILGILPGPPTSGKGGYWWYQGASFWSTYLDYWHWTGDDSYAANTSRALMSQTGQNFDFLPANWTASMGNDDQCFWATAALLAAEYQFPEVEGKPKWIDLAINAWEQQAGPWRRDNTCNGGLRWQIPPINAGYDYKQTTSNACFLNMGARLARLTGNATFAEHAEKTWDWLSEVGFIDDTTWAVYDGAKVERNCTGINKLQASLNAAFLIQGSAFLYNFTKGSDVWRERTQNLTTPFFRDFFRDGVLYETGCEGTRGRCTSDFLFMKGYVHRWLSVATQVAPFLAEKVLPGLKDSAEAAVKQCVEGNSTVSYRCGFYWSSGEFVDPEEDGSTSGVGEGLNVLSAVSALLVSDAKAPVILSAVGNETSRDSTQGTSTTGAAATSTVKPGAGPRIGLDVSLIVGALIAAAWVF